MTGSFLEASALRRSVAAVIDRRRAPFAEARRRFDVALLDAGDELIDGFNVAAGRIVLFRA